MIHQFKNNGYNIVIDVNSGAIHVVDDVTYDFMALWQESGRDASFAAMKDSHPEVSVAELTEIQGEIDQLITDGSLFTEDDYEPKIKNFAARPTVVKALCLHITHDCNLACKYCFAEEGEYHTGKRELMSYEVGKQALDFLVVKSVKELCISMKAEHPLPCRPTVHRNDNPFHCLKNRLRGAKIRNIFG